MASRRRSAERSARAECRRDGDLAAAAAAGATLTGREGGGAPCGPRPCRTGLGEAGPGRAEGGGRRRDRREAHGDLEAGEGGAGSAGGAGPAPGGPGGGGGGGGGG